MENQELNENIKKSIERAAAKGAKEGGATGVIRFRVLSLVAVLVVVLGGLFFIKYSIEKKWSDFTKDIKDQFTFAEPAKSHDLVLDNNGVFGYTAADFAEVILGDRTLQKKVEVYETKISDMVTITDTGFANWNIFTKTQAITYKGIATYTVDLSHLTKADFFVDKTEKTVAIIIPHSVCEKINIPSDEIEFGDMERGWLAFGEIKLTPEQFSDIETEVRIRLDGKLIELNEAQTADRFAKLTVWEMYHPLISAVAPGYNLKVVFSD